MTLRSTRCGRNGTYCDNNTSSASALCLVAKNRLDGFRWVYLIKGIAGRIFWKLVQTYAQISLRVRIVRLQSQGFAKFTDGFLQTAFVG